jgi:NADP-dependent 3-hydroxy acid dehydrogenase YdfG
MKVVAIIDAGPQRGCEQIAKAFANSSYTVALLSRSVESMAGLVALLGNNSHTFCCDVTKPRYVQGSIPEPTQVLFD